MKKTDAEIIEWWNHWMTHLRQAKAGLHDPVFPQDIDFYLEVDRLWSKVEEKFDNVMSTLNVDYEDMFPAKDDD